MIPSMHLADPVPSSLDWSIELVATRNPPLFRERKDCDRVRREQTSNRGKGWEYSRNAGAAAARSGKFHRHLMPPKFQPLVKAGE